MPRNRNRRKKKGGGGGGQKKNHGRRGGGRGRDGQNQQHHRNQQNGRGGHGRNRDHGADPFGTRTPQGQQGDWNGGKQHQSKKTQLCRNWSKNGRCKFGDSCRFRHDTRTNPFGGNDFSERASDPFGTRAPQQQQGNRSKSKNRQNKKNQMCRNWAQNGRCTFGDSCRYQHGQAADPFGGNQSMMGRNDPFGGNQSMMGRNDPFGGNRSTMGRNDPFSNTETGNTNVKMQSGQSHTQGQFNSFRSNNTLQAGDPFGMVNTSRARNDPFHSTMNGGIEQNMRTQSNPFGSSNEMQTQDPFDAMNSSRTMSGNHFGTTTAPVVAHDSFRTNTARLNDPFGMKPTENRISDSSSPSNAFPGASLNNMGNHQTSVNLPSRPSAASDTASRGGDESTPRLHRVEREAYEKTLDVFDVTPGMNTPIPLVPPPPEYV